METINNSSLDKSKIIINPILIDILSLILCLDTHLTLVLGECYEVSDWRIFGVALGISEAELDRIHMDELGKSLRCQKAMFAKWLDHYEATWRGLVQALLYPPLNARHVARAVAEKHLTTQSS